MKLIAVDSSVLISAVRGSTLPPSPSDAVATSIRQHDAAAKACLEKLRRDGHRLALPAPVISEYLIKSANVIEDAANLNRFEQIEFGAPAAILAARLERNAAAFEGKGEKKRGDSRSTEKVNLRIDAFILACAETAGCQLLLTMNAKDFAALTRGFDALRIQVTGVPATEPEQLSFE